MDYRILWDIIDGLRDELNIANDGINDLNDVVKDLQAEAIEQIKDNKRLNDKDGLYDEVKELQAEIEELKECNRRRGEQVKIGRKKLKECKILQAENDRLVKQVGSLSNSNSNTHTHTLGSVRCSIAREIAEYMSHNDGCMGARMFLIPRDEFKHGEYDHTIYWDDGME